MYSIVMFGGMVGDSVRMDAYDLALKRTIKPGAVVLDIGSGTGIFSLLACKYGAARVYSLEMANAILIGQACARTNGYADRIQFIQAMSTDIDLPERVDVIVSDIRGVLPFFHTHLPSIIDARKRFLRVGGVQIPQRDRIWMVPVETADSYTQLVRGHHPNTYGINMEPALPFTFNMRHGVLLQHKDMLSKPLCWYTLDYTTVETSDRAETLTWTAARDGVCHGICGWFDAELIDGVGFANTPGLPRTVYRQSLFPWPEPVSVKAGDIIRSTIKANLINDNYIWRWDSQVFSPESPDQPRIEFRQSDFLGQLRVTPELRKRTAQYVPNLKPSSLVDRQILNWIDGSRSVEEIARSVMQHFPDQFKQEREAMERVASLSFSHSK